MAQIPSDLPERLIQYRVEHNLTLKQFAERARITPQTVGNIERRKRGTTTLLSLRKIEGVIGRTEDAG